MAVLCLVGGQLKAFTAYDCSNKSNIIESYSLLEPDACAASDKAGEVETTVYREIVQIKQDVIIPIFSCQVIKTIVSQYLWTLVLSWHHQIHSVQGTQGSRSLGVLASKDAREGRH
jgi:hypothetical protein